MSEVVTKSPYDVATPDPARSPWKIRRGSHGRECWHILRWIGATGFVEYLGADGVVKNTQSNFRSEAAATRAIEKWAKRNVGVTHG